ncbi:MAG: excinuclease ABC subunit UvrB [Nitrospinota bacterium]|nr:excinuclease ABC subunit UvrB [Nitrospinota bacterium]
MSNFELFSEFKPSGDQPSAIRSILKNFENGKKKQVLLGVTGSGKTFTMANVIQELKKPTLVLAHNKTLAAQLYNEFKEFFPNNAVEYFVSYYDYYQPEAYVPTTNTFIEKDASINDELDRLRHSATLSALTRKDVLVVASVSAIYGLGHPSDFIDLHVHVEKGMSVNRDEFLKDLVRIQYRRDDLELLRSTFRVRGDVIEIHLPHIDDYIVRIELFGDEIDKISKIDYLRRSKGVEVSCIDFYPNTHYITPDERLALAIDKIEQEMYEQINFLEKEDKFLEGKRLSDRTREDLEMLREVGFCHGIENYSRHLDGREEGEQPATLFSYFKDDLLVIIDESHQTIPQFRAMYNGDRSRKKTLVSHGFRLPSALDNRPLRFDEFETELKEVLYVSATPSDYEVTDSNGVVVEQIIRPTGLIDPIVQVRPAKSQVDDLISEAKKVISQGDRVLATTLTKRFSEDLSEYYDDLGFKVRYLHSDINAVERVSIIRDFRAGEFDILIGINLLREGLDLPEVALVAIFDADKEGFLRSETALIQTAGRAARHLDGKVIMYADNPTRSMNRSIQEMDRRRTIQLEYNKRKGITPKSIQKKLNPLLNSSYTTEGKDKFNKIEWENVPEYFTEEDKLDLEKLRLEMREAAKKLDFEHAAHLRDKIFSFEKRQLGIKV